MSEALFYDPAVLKVVRAILASRGIRGEQDLEDGIGEVVLACIEHVRRTGRPPEGAEEAIVIARSIASAHGVDEARKRLHRSKSNAGATADADEHAQQRPPSLDPVDQERMLGAIRQVLRDDEIRVLADVGAGVPQTELAAETGTAPATQRKRTEASRDKAMRALGARGYWLAGGFAALLAGVGAVIYAGAFRTPGDPTHNDPREQAAEQRSEAAAACGARSWDACASALDRAAQLDPKGDRAADVEALRAAIAAGRGDAGPQDGGLRENAAPTERR
jgi:hypothetical protein